MQKYLYSFKLYFLNSFQYRFNTVINLIMSNISLLVTAIFWLIIYRSNTQGTINGYSLSDMLTYYVASSLFRSFILNSGGFEMCYMIKNGGLSNVLIKPYNINTFLYFKNLSNSLIGFVQQFSFLIITLPLFAKYLTWNITLKNFVILIVFLIISSIISFLICTIFGMMAFWLTDATAIMWSFAVILNFLSGMLIPLDFFPSWSVKFLELMPFASFTFIPAKIYMNQLSAQKILFLLMVYIGWIFTLIGIKSMIWRHGVKKYSAIGA